VRKVAVRGVLGGCGAVVENNGGLRNTFE